VNIAPVQKEPLTFKDMENKVIILGGMTSVGKSAVAIE